MIGVKATGSKRKEIPFKPGQKRKKNQNKNVNGRREVQRGSHGEERKKAWKNSSVRAIVMFVFGVIVRVQQRNGLIGLLYQARPLFLLLRAEKLFGKLKRKQVDLWDKH